VSAREKVAVARTLIERQVLALGARRSPGSTSRGGGRVLAYHAIGDAPAGWGTTNSVSAERLRRQVRVALALGFHFVPADLIARGESQPRDLAITFDDGLRSVINGAEPILREYGVPWTMFVVTDWAEGKHSFEPGIFLNWREIEALFARGVRIGSHSVTHPNFARLSAEEAGDELARSRATIAARLGLPPTEFAIPFGQSHDWSASAHRAAAVAGYTAIYAQSERRRPPGTTPRTFITRFDDERLFHAALRGAFDNWEEWF
jgi:peptidoglycan/xylan/chitin deacetylase (PgdA/CDA1 family)